MTKHQIGWAGRVVLLTLGLASARDVVAEEAFHVRPVGQVSGPCWAVQVVGRYAYTGGVSGLRILDVSNPTSPVTVGGLFLPGSYINAIQIKSGLAYFTGGYSGLQIADVTNPSSPTLRGLYDTPGYAGGVFVSGNLAYIADHAGGLRIVDVSNPSSPTLRGSYRTPDYPMDVFVSGGLAYIADRSGFAIVDVTNPSSPTLRSYPPDNLASYVFYSNHVAYITGYRGVSGGAMAFFHAFDVTNPSSPRRGEVRYGGVPSYGGGVYVFANFAYVVLDGLRVFDVSSPFSPTLRGFYPLGGYGRVVACGDLVYVADNSYGLRIFQLTGLTAARHWQLYR